MVLGEPFLVLTIVTTPDNDFVSFSVLASIAVKAKSLVGIRSEVSRCSWNISMELISSALVLSDDKSEASSDPVVGLDRKNPSLVSIESDGASSCIKDKVLSNVVS